MDIGSVVRDSAVESVLSALAELAEGAAADGPAAAQATPSGVGTALAAAAEAPADGTSLPPAVPGTRADHNAETAAVQPFVRPPPSTAEAPRPVAGEQPMVQPATSGAILPADQLVPVMLSSLQVDPSAAWPLNPRGFVAPLPDPARPPASPPSPPDYEPLPPWPEEGAVEHEPARVDDGGPGDVVDDEPDEDWCEPLTRALREALAAPTAPASLLAAAEQWRRGRCVVLACPQGRDPAGPAWAYALWPRVRPARRLELHGTRVEARLSWASLPPASPWCHVRVVKEHHPRRGRQLVPLDAMAGMTVACEIQLGPVLVRPLRWAVACLRIDAVRRFWTALGAQWSATVVVCSRPLAAEAPASVRPAC